MNKSKCSLVKAQKVENFFRKLKVIKSPIKKQIIPKGLSLK